MKVFFAVTAAILVFAGNSLVLSSCASLSPPETALRHPQATLPPEETALRHPQAALPPEETALRHPQTTLPPEDAPLHPQVTIPPESSTPVETSPWLLIPEVVPGTAIPEIPPEFPGSPEHIMGQGVASSEELADFLLYINARADYDFVHSLSLYYVEEAAAEGVNHDTAFAQMCLETGFLRYGGLVTPDMNNFCGLGAIGPQETGLFFPDPRTGVRAHVQHLKAYATDDPLNQDLVDPRFRYVKRGSSPTIHGLAGTWATDRNYNIKIARILENLHEFVSGEEE